jgi:large subunit ribosomal protein L22
MKLNMEVKASLKYLRISPRKVRLVTGLIKGLSVKNAEAQLANFSKKSSLPVLKLLKSAVANAENNFQLDKNNLYIKIARVDEGPALKRWRARARGSAFTIKKRTSHIFIILDEIKKKQKAQIQSEKIEKKNKIIKTEDSKQKVEKKELKSSKTKMSHFKKTELENTKKAPSGVALKKKVFRRKTI